MALPDLGITALKVKVDTGARSSALHAFNVRIVEQAGKSIVHFQVHPLQRNSVQTITTQAPLTEQRYVRNSGGQIELRPVIQTTLSLGQFEWPIELTLTNRDMMGFRMLLGRQAIRQRFYVHAGASYLQSSRL